MKALLLISGLLILVLGFQNCGSDLQLESNTNIEESQNQGDKTIGFDDFQASPRDVVLPGTFQCMSIAQSSYRVTVKNFIKSNFSKILVNGEEVYNSCGLQQLNYVVLNKDDLLIDAPTEKHKKWASELLPNKIDVLIDENCDGSESLVYELLPSGFDYSIKEKTECGTHALYLDAVLNF